MKFCRRLFYCVPGKGAPPGSVLDMMQQDRQVIDWSNNTAKVHVDRDGPIMLLEIGLDPQSLKSLADGLLNLKQGLDLKMILPSFQGNPIPVIESWVVYIKEAAGSDRSLLAHPTQNEWVASLLLSTPTMERLKNEMSKWVQSTSSDRLELSIVELGRFSYPSNIQIKFRLI